jgi:hypothetical protein
MLQDITMNTFLIAVTVFFVFLIIVEVWTFQTTKWEYRRKMRSGDTSCKMQKTWYGWRVKELPELDI